MASGIIQGTVTTTDGETVEMSWLVDDTVSPTKWYNATHPVNGAGNSVAFGTGVDGATVPRVSLATNVALPAGTNAIGKLSANSGVDIGDVDVTSVPTDPFGANADAASATGSISAKLRAIASTGIPITGTVTVGSHAVTVASGGVASGAIASGALASGSVASGAFASGSIGSGALASGSVASGALASGSVTDGALVTIGAKADAKSTATDTTSVSAMSVWKQISASVQAAVTALGSTALDLGSGTAGTRTLRTIVDSSQLAALATSQPAMSTGFQAVGLPSDLPWPKGLSNRCFGVAFATLTRPANTTAYTAGDSISDNATAGSVTALISGNLSDTNDDPIFISSIHIASTDTGLAGKKLRAYLFNTDPTASSGVSGGDNAAYSQKMAGYLGSFMGWMETGFSDGSVGRLVPCYNETNYTQAGGFIVVPPKSGARTLYIQYQAVEAFTPSANSTTIIGTARGWQGRAA